MRISDWSSDVCSSDLADGAGLSADHTLLSGAPALCARPARYAQSPHIPPCYVLRSFLPHSMRSHRIFATEPGGHAVIPRSARAIVYTRSHVVCFLTGTTKRYPKRLGWRMRE